MKYTTLKIKFDRNGEVSRAVGNIGRTRRNKAAAVLWSDQKIEPTFWYKLRRFIPRAVEYFNECMNEAARIARSTDEPAPDIHYTNPIKGLLEDRV